jgi:hypothetical protein
MTSPTWRHPRRRFDHAMTVVLALAAVALANPSSAADFDRTVPAARGVRLDVRVFGGEVVVHAWDRDAVRVQATHFRTDDIDVQSANQVIAISAHSLRGTPHGIDFDIHVPAWMPVTITGTYVDITVEGTRAPVSAQTVRGDVAVRGGADTLLLKSVEGEVTLEDARGRADLTAVNNGIRITRLQGDVVAETVNGSVKLQAVAAASVEVSTIGGDISWEGVMAPGSRYQFATHSGDVDVSLGGAADVTVSARAFHGLVRSTLPVPLPDRVAAGKKATFTLGSGAARLDLETFSGTISLR